MKIAAVPAFELLIAIKNVRCAHRSSMPLSAIPSDPFRDEKAANKGRRDKYKFKMTRTIPDNNSLSEDNA